VQVQKLGLSVSEYAKARDIIMALPSAVPGTTSAVGAKIYGEMFSILGADETGRNLDKLAAFTMSIANQKRGKFRSGGRAPSRYGQVRRFATQIR
jgi:hypothetical protein